MTAHEPFRGEPLTACDAEALALVARGLRAAAIAGALGVAVPTAERRLARIARKLGTADRAGMVAAGHDAGVLRADPPAEATALGARHMQVLLGLRAFPVPPRFERGRPGRNPHAAHGAPGRLGTGAPQPWTRSASKARSGAPGALPDTSPAHAGPDTPPEGTTMTYRHIHLVVDRSGSMADKKTDTEGGIKALLADQAEMPGRTTVSLTEFDATVNHAYAMRDISQVPDYELVPRGMTALLDAVGESIVQLKRTIKAMPTEERPDAVVLVIMTDGQENSSKEWTLDAVRRQIEKRQAKGWTFLFLGADIDAFGTAGGMGIAADQTLSYAGNHTVAAFSTTSGTMTRATSTGTYVFDDSDRAKADGDA